MGKYDLYLRVVNPSRINTLYAILLKKQNDGYGLRVVKHLEHLLQLIEGSDLHNCQLPHNYLATQSKQIPK